MIVAFGISFLLLAAMFALFLLNVAGSSERAGHHEIAPAYKTSPIPLDEQMVAEEPEPAEAKSSPLRRLFGRARHPRR